MLSGLFTGARAPSTTTIPLFPLRTVLFPGGLLPLKVFEQRYIDMTKACLKDGQPFGVVMITAGDEVATRGGTPSFANFGTLATITGWDMPELGILHVATVGLTRFKVREHRVQPDKLVLCVDQVILRDERPKVEAVAAALARGYTQAQLEPDEAAAAAQADPAAVENAAPTWTAGTKRFGELKPGPGRDPLY